MPFPTFTLGAIAHSSIEKPTVFIDKILFTAQTTLILERNQIVVFVGPNNAGKSVALTEIYNHVRGQNLHKKIVQAVSLERTGYPGDVLNYLDRLYRRSPAHPNHILVGGDLLIDTNGLNDMWGNEPLHQLSDIFTLFLSTEGRLQVSLTPPSISLLTESPTHPIHYLLENDEYEKTFNSYFRRAFGQDLIVNRGAGKQVPLHVGSRPALLPEEDRVSRSYLEKLSRLPTLQEQGDGMRSFVGVLMSAFVAEQSMIFIDEPEAFLHPPQAYILGQMLANDLSSDKQIFLATHSEDLLKGLIDKYSDRVKVVRIQRDGNRNQLNELNGEAIKTLWADPLLRYSNILSGLFHSKVIVCESDGDCRFFAAILDAIVEQEHIPNPDTLFVHCGGKHRIPVVVNALIKVGVKVCVVADFDVLRDQSPLKEIYEGLGGTWSDIENKWRTLKQTIDTKRPELDTDAIKKDVNELLLQVTDKTFPDQIVREIKKLLTKASAWSQAKEQGSSYIPNGQPTQILNELISLFKAVRLNVIPVGELESFDKTLGGHGPRWVNDVLQKDLGLSPELGEARRFVQQLLAQ